MPGDATALRNYTRQWEYDEVGNILKLIHTANNGNWNRTYNYDDNNNRLISTKVGETTVGYNYNEHGSMTEMPHLQNMEWDFAERLSHITRGTTEAYYNYDGSGERIRKVVEKGNIAETRLYLGGVEVFRKKVGNNLELEREMLHIMDDTRRIALVETLTVDNEVAVNNAIPVQRYQLSNNIESATLELDENVNIISYEEYYPYGDTSYQAGRSTSEVSQKRYRYTGKEKDEESGLYYHGARYYAAWLGRWTTVDPAGLVDGLNLYMYCRGDPVKLWDPDGNTGDVAVSNNRPPIDIGSDVYKLGGTLYNEMHRRLTEASEKDGEIGRVGRLLKTLWNTHESRLRVFETDATELLADVRDGVPGVSLNLAIGVMDTRVTNAYQNIFHEFFHNIDMILGLRRNPNNPVPSFADDFGHNNELYHAIKADYYRLSGQGNLPVGSYHKVSERQYRIAQSKLTGDPRTISYTSDIIGIAFSVIRTPDSENFSATNMMGRDMNILGSVSPAAEFFANVAAAAITNPEAFENLRDNFPNAYNVFRRVLESMIHGGR
jgi:RHS repeat-associated protein